MTRVRLADDAPADTTVDALIIGVHRVPGSHDLRLASGAERLDRAFRGGLRTALAAVGATGRAEEVSRLATLGAIKAKSLVAVGLGDAPAKGDRVPAETLRRAAGAAVRSLGGLRTAATTLALAGDEPGAVGAVAEGALLGAYQYTRYRQPRDGRAPVQTVTILGPTTRPAKAALRRGTVIAESVVLTRDLVNTPAGELHPAELAAAAQTACASLDLDVDVLDDRALRKGGYGGLVGVGQGSSHPPRLVRIAYRPTRGGPHVALVGKGITFDSGGLSLKQPQQMEYMKSDMGGAAAVLAALVATARLQLPIRVTGWLPTAENMPSGMAIHPADVLQIYGGKTVEVLNTDAEGRLILADAITRAGEEKPDVILDVATLTGAQVIALGSRVFAIMANDDDLRAAVTAAADRAGELAWPMPLPVELRASLDSEVADIANIGERAGGMLVAGLFLKEFVGDGIAWAHLDIAGPSFNDGEPWGYTPKGGTGVGVRTLVAYLEDISQRG